MSNIIEPLILTRKDGKIVDVIFYNNADIDEVEILDIKKLKFESTKVKDITKSDIRDCVFSGNETLYFAIPIKFGGFSIFCYDNC